MQEKTVRKIMIEYFEKKNRKVIPRRGAGPDFMEEGKAIEVKGSGAKGSRFSKAVSQCARYALEYKGLEVAFPIDVLSAENLIKFTLLCRIVWELKRKYIKTYLIAKDTLYAPTKLVEEWKKRDPFLLDVDGFQKFLDERLKEEEKEAKCKCFHLVKSFDDGRRVLTSLLDRIPTWSCFRDESFQNTTEKIETNLSRVNVAIERAFREEVRYKPDMILPVSENEF